MKAIRVHGYGGVDRLSYEDVDPPEPAAGEALVKVAAAGLNFLDVYYRTGVNKAPRIPFTLGVEAAGEVEALGSGVTEVSPGDRVVFSMVLGAFAEFATVPAWRLVKLPASISFENGAALSLQGMTAHYLTHSTFPLHPGHTALIHAAAGGAGYLLTQVARMRGATVFATAGTAAKAELARQAGARHVIVYSEQDFEREVKRLTEGRGVDVVYDAVGAATFEKSLNCLRPRGYMVLYGNSSGPVPPIDPMVLGHKGSLFLTRPGLNRYSATRDEIVDRMNDLFGWIMSGALALRLDRVCPLREIATAMSDLEARRTAGKVVFSL